MRSGEGIISILNKLADMVILSALWFVHSLPIITIGASSAALYHTIIKVIRQDRGYAFATFRKSFKENFRPSLPPTIIYLICFIVSGITCYVFWDDTEGLLSNAYVMFGMFCIIILIITMLHTFAAIGRFTLSRNELITVVVRLTSGHLLMNIVILLLLVAAAELVIMYIPLIAIAVPSLFFFLFSLIEEPLFKKHIRFEDDWNTDLFHNEELPFNKDDSEKNE